MVQKSQSEPHLVDYDYCSVCSAEIEIYERDDGERLTLWECQCLLSGARVVDVGRRG